MQRCQSRTTLQITKHALSPPRGDICGKRHAAGAMLSNLVHNERRFLSTNPRAKKICTKFIIVVFTHIFFRFSISREPSDTSFSSRSEIMSVESVLLSFLVFAVIGDKEEEVSTLEVFVSDQCLAHARTAHRGCVRTRNEIHAPSLKARRWQSGMLLAVPRTRLATLCLGRFARCLQQGCVHCDQTESQNSPTGARVHKRTTGCPHSDTQLFRAR